MLAAGWANLGRVQAQSAVVHLSVDVSQVVRTVDPRLFGVNAAVWDSYFDTPQTFSRLQEMDAQVLRFPGGSLSDEYHWLTDTSGTNTTYHYPTSFDRFATIATNLGAQVFITVNYGTGTPQEAADWVRYANLTKGCGFKFWEIGNETFGSWETDTNSLPHDPITYAQRAKDYIAQMKAVDPTIKVGVVVVTGEDSFANYTDAAHTVTNPVTHVSHQGWTPVLLTYLKSLGVRPDFVIDHRYPQNPGSESDGWLLQSSRTWTTDAANLRQQVTDYLGPAGAAVELVCTENNSVTTRPGKQTTSLVNGLFLADSVGQILQTQFNALLWWDLRNARDTTNNNSAYLYGWRQYGDYGIIDGLNSPYPTFYVAKLLQYFARGGDRVVRATSDNLSLALYAAFRTNGALSLLVINKTATASLDANVALTGYQPDAGAQVFSYGIPQDTAAETGVGSPDLAQTNFDGASANFTFSFPAYSATVISLAPVSPQLSPEPNPGFPGPSFALRVTGQAGVPYVLQVSTDLVSWSSVATNIAGSGPWVWTDPDATNSGPRFYRVGWMP